MGTRVKTDDPELEKACALADYLQAAREGTHKGMNLGEIIDALQSAEVDATVCFDFGGLEPTGVKSYRGYYSDLALGFADEGMKAGELLTTLKAAVGAVFEGYKGGDFKMDRVTPVWVANYGRSDGVAIVGVENHGWRVILRTALID